MENKYNLTLEQNIFLAKKNLVDNIYANVETIDIKDGVRKKLIAGEESARMSYSLATIITDAPVEIEPRAAAWSAEECFRPELYEIFLQCFYKTTQEPYTQLSPLLLS